MIKLRDLTDEQLNRAIKITLALIIILVVGFGIYYYISRYYTPSPTVVEKEVSDVEEALRKNPNSVSARTYLGNLYLREERTDDAIEQFKLGLKISKNHPPALVGLGLAYMQKEDYKKATDTFKKEIEAGKKGTYAHIDPWLEQAHFYLGSIYLKQKKYRLAIEEFKQALAIKPTASDNHYFLGLAYLKNKSYDEAIKEFNEALKYEPKFAEAHYGLGQAYEKKGEKDKAKEEYQKASTIKPDYKEAKEALERLK